MPADLELLKQADFILSKCGGRRATPDAVVVPIEKKFLVPMLLQPGQSQLFIKEITGDTPWELRGISSDQTSGTITGVRIQIQLPNGRFLIGGNGQDAGQFAWVGSYRYNVAPGVECNPGSKFQIVLTDMGNLEEPFAFNLVLDGCYNYYLKGGRLEPVDSVAEELRYAGIVNENILAPCWMAGYGPVTPAGFDDDYFVYSSDVGTLTVGSTLFTTLKIPIDAGLDFQLRRMLPDVQVGAGVTAGVIRARLRAGAGYALSDDFSDLARYLTAVEAPHDWKVRGGDAVYVDLQLADGAGAGDLTMQMHLEGVRRRKL